MTTTAKGYPSGSTPTPAAPAPGSGTSEFKLALLAIGGTLATGGLKALSGVALATGQWWAIPVSLAITSLGYSLARGLAKRGVASPATPDAAPGSSGSPAGSATG